MMQLKLLGSAAASAVVRRASRRTGRRGRSLNGGFISSVSVSREARLTAPEAGALPISNCIVTAKGSAPVLIRAQQRDLSGRWLFFHRLHFEPCRGSGRPHSGRWERQIRTLPEIATTTQFH
jgi:hypothetical protein